ncbi:MAG: pyridoxamine 5'-phosphate oxidase family protein [Anaerolineae bacterium]|jgi:nitroimidazol reductase NimA-like FMN-containing flavoprotein (pyridoxamine 5'-phosphate oxidase superfamily)
MTDRNGTESALRDLFARQQLAVLATKESNGHPYANLMAFAVSDDLKTLLLVTSRATRKYANLSAEPRMALLIDSRSHHTSDIHEAMAVTVLGDAEEVSGAERRRLLPTYVAKHPHLKEFASSPSCALFRVRVRSYYLVRRFQEVTELHVGR